MLLYDKETDNRQHYAPITENSMRLRYPTQPCPQISQTPPMYLFCTTLNRLLTSCGHRPEAFSQVAALARLPSKTNRVSRPNTTPGCIRASLQAVAQVVSQSLLGRQRTGSLLRRCGGWLKSRTPIRRQSFSPDVECGPELPAKKNGGLASSPPGPDGTLRLQL